MKINCYIALVAAALACACNPLADTDDMDNNVQATRIAFSPEVVTLDNAGRNAEEDQGQNVIVTLNPKARRSMAWSAETDKTKTWCTLTECSVTDADGVTHRGFRITATENTAYKRTATVTLTAADGTQETLRVVQTGVYPDAEVTVDPKQIEFNADEIVPVDVSFTTNMGDVYAVSRDEDADWISWEDLGGNVIRFTAAPWDDEEQPRTANVYITVGSGETSAATAKIPVTQLAKDLYCYVWGASLFDYDRFELARRMTKSEAGVYRFDAYFTAGNAPEIRVNTVLRADYYPAYALAADGRIVTLNSAADAVPAGPAIDIDGMRTLTIDLNAMTYTLSRIAIANCMPDDAAAACPSKAFRTKDGGVKIWMTRNLNWNGGPEIGAMKLGSRLVPAYSGSATSGGYDPQDPYIERNPAYDEEESGGSVKGDQAVTDRHGRLYTLDEILLGTPAGGLGRGITSIEWPSAYNVGSTFVDAVGTQITARVTAGVCAPFRQCAPCRSRDAIRVRYRRSVAVLGATIISPVSPLIISLSPVFISSMHSDAPTIAAIPLARAMMQTWLVTLPRAVTTPAMRLKSISAVSDGASSSATTIVPGASPANGFSAVSPVRIRRMRPHTSRTSSVRPPRYSSSSAASMPHTFSQASSKARSAEKPCFEIRSSTCSASIGSSAISKCAAKMSFSAANTPSSAFACASAA